MAVDQHASGLHLIQGLQVGGDLRQRVETAWGVEFADMRRDHGARAPGEADRVLHVAAERQNRFGQRRGQFQFQWRDAASQTQRTRLVGNDPIHRIVGGAHDGTVVVQERIGEMAQAALRFMLVGQHRLAGEVARGRHQRSAEVVQQQGMQRRVGQQTADLCETGRDQRRQSRIAAFGQQHDGAGRRSDEAFLFRRNVHDGAQGLAVTHHHRQRFGRARLAFAQAGDRRIAGGIA